LRTGCLLLAALNVLTFGQGRSPALPPLLEDAEKALRAGPFSVMQKTRVPPSGDKHDYMSVGPYWWPDPAKPDGLPYIRRDGETNPERTSNASDTTALRNLNEAVPVLALAFRETGDERFAEHAAKLIRAWYLDPATRMNPNLNYGQSIPGRTEGRGIGIIDTAFLVTFCDQLRWIEKSKAWTAEDRAGIRKWMSAYLDWLVKSKNGKEEAQEKNNHGTWYDAQVAALADFTGNRELTRSVLEAAKARRIASQIEADGRQPHELARTRSLSYSTMNLRAFFELAAIGDRAGVDLWRFETRDGRGIRKALDYLAPYADPAVKWPGQQINGDGIGLRLEIGALLRRAALAYREPKYEAMLGALPKRALDRARWQLLYPPLR
jgi:hypothetical protein